MKYKEVENPIYEIKLENYENIFNIYVDENDMYYYNILKKVDFPEDLDSSVYDFYQTKPKDSYHLISYNFYKTPRLWWLICAANQIDNPIELPTIGTILKIIKPFYVSQVLSKINSE